jgi:3-oxoadipate enol-lactonase
VAVETRRITIATEEPSRLTLAVLESGVGGLPLLLVHGFTGAKEDFADEVDRLGSLGFHVVAPDHRGHGESDHPPDEDQYTLDLLATDMFGLADALGWGRFDLLGHSMGGMVAQLMVLSRADRVDRLVLMDTHHGALGGIDEDLVALGVELARSDGLAVIQQVLKDFGDPLDNPAHARLCRERDGYEAWSDGKLLACSPVMYAALVPQFTRFDDRLDQLASLDHPTLVVVGELDERFLGPATELASAIPDARLVVLEDGGHSPQFEAMHAWRAAVDAFLVRAIATAP